MSNFRVGQKVVCVDDRDQGGGHDVHYGEVYTVSWIGMYSHPLFGVEFAVRLDGVPRYCPIVEDDIPLRATRFRPVVERKTDISIFKAMLEDKKSRVRA